MTLHPTLAAVTARIIERSHPTRQAYLQQVDAAAQREAGARRLGCANVAHAFAAMPEDDKGRATALDKIKVVAPRAPNIGIVNAYNDLLSAHAPLQHYPDLIKDEARKLGATAQVAGGVPAMCDGVTQGTPGMELSLFSRDVIAMATAVSLSHDVFDCALMLGVCDKIVPGLLIGALHFGHLPTVFVPAGPMTSGLSNNAKAKEKVALAELEYGYTGKVGDHRKWAEVKAKSAYAVAKEKCDDLAGNPKDVCVKEAKSGLVKGNADAAQNVARALAIIAVSDAGESACIAASAPAALVGLAGQPAVKGSADAAQQVARALAHFTTSDAGKSACAAASAPAALEPAGTKTTVAIPLASVNAVPTFVLARPRKTLNVTT